MKSQLRRIGAVGILSVLGVVAASCSSSPPAKQSSSSSTTTTATTSTPTTVPGVTTIPYSASKNARSDVTISGGCLHEPNNDWVLHGTVVNPTQKAAGFMIVVDYVTQPGNTVLDTEIANVPSVAPHQSAPWGTSWLHAGNGVACVIREAQYS